MSLTLAAIWIHPVKSLAGMCVDRAWVDDRGLRHDRRFMIVDAEGRFVTQREHPAMARIHARVDGERLTLSANERSPLEVALEVEGPSCEVIVWRDRCAAIDAGDAPARWLSEALSMHVRLVRMPASTRRAVDPEYAREGDIVSFADGFPFLLATEASLDALNARLARPVDMRRFRPNLVVAGASPFAEDAWRELAIGGVRFGVRKPCARCAIVTVDPDLGTREKEPLATLATFRSRDHGVLFGQNLVHDGEGELSVGDAVRVIA